MKLGVAISCFKAYRDVALNVEIIRKLWSSHNDSYISVCCNHPETLETITELDVDRAVAGSDLPFDNKLQLRHRQVDCWQRSNQAAVNNADYVIHFHADAHALRVEPILEIIEEMERRECWIAGRGRGLSYRSEKATQGDVDDHFFISNTMESARNKLWEVKPGNILISGTSETFLSFSIREQLGEKRFYFYSDMSECMVDIDKVEKDPFYHDNVRHRQLNPFNYDSERAFLHTRYWDIKRKFMEEEYRQRFAEIAHLWPD